MVIPVAKGVGGLIPGNVKSENGVEQIRNVHQSTNDRIWYNCERLKIALTVNQYQKQ